MINLVTSEEARDFECTMGTKELLSMLDPDDDAMETLRARETRPISS